MSEQFLWTALYVYVGLQFQKDLHENIGTRVAIMLVWPLLWIGAWR